MSEENQDKGFSSETENFVIPPVEEEKKGIDQRHFAWVYLIATIGIIVIAFRYFNADTGPDYGAVIRIVASSMQGVALWLVTALGFAAALNGLKCNLYEEIVDQHNMAIAVLLGFAWLSLALIIHG
jgi:hypothetical protein